MYEASFLSRLAHLMVVFIFKYAQSINCIFKCTGFLVHKIKEGKGLLSLNCKPTLIAKFFNELINRQAVTKGCL